MYNEFTYIKTDVSKKVNTASSFLTNVKKARFCQFKESDVKKASVKFTCCDFIVPAV